MKDYLSDCIRALFSRRFGNLAIGWNWHIIYEFEKKRSILTSSKYMIRQKKLSVWTRLFGMPDPIIAAKD
jgi:hypothetical protein